MPISYFIYRCPLCGNDPTRQGRGDAWCEGCGARFAQGISPGTVLVTRSDGSTTEEDAAELGRMVTAPESRLPGSGGEHAETRVSFMIATVEEPIRHRGRLLGFIERPGPPSSGRLEADLQAVRFRGDDGTDWGCGYLEVRAIQASSSSVQLSPRGGGVVTLRFLDDSPRRWEELLRTRLRHAWREAGRGEIVEFQPHIRTG